MEKNYFELPVWGNNPKNQNLISFRAALEAMVANKGFDLQMYGKIVFSEKGKYFVRTSGVDRSILAFGTEMSFEEAKKTFVNREPFLKWLMQTHNLGYNEFAYCQRFEKLFPVIASTVLCKEELIDIFLEKNGTCLKDAATKAVFEDYDFELGYGIICLFNSIDFNETIREFNNDHSKYSFMKVNKRCYFNDGSQSMTEDPMFIYDEKYKMDIEKALKMADGNEMLTNLIKTCIKNGDRYMLYDAACDLLMPIKPNTIFVPTDVLFRW